MADLYNKKGEDQENRQTTLFESMLTKNAKSFSTALEKEGAKEEKREKEKSSPQGALVHPLAATVGDAPVTDVHANPGKKEITNPFFLFWKMLMQIIRIVLAPSPLSHL
jgi:hypothetical protein